MHVVHVNDIENVHAAVMVCNKHVMASRHVANNNCQSLDMYAMIDIYHSHSFIHGTNFHEFHETSCITMKFQQLQDLVGSHLVSFVKIQL